MGDFEASLDLTGVGAPLGKVLGTATIAGSLKSDNSDASGLDWNLVGQTGAVTIGGDVDALTLGDGAGGLSALTKLSLGNVLSATVTVGGDVPSVSAKSWLAGSITAQSLASLVVNGNFGADLSLVLPPGSPATKSALGSASIAGNLIGGNWDVTGKTGGITIKGFQAPLEMQMANVASISTTSPLVRALENGIPTYLIAVGEAGTIYPIHFASLATWPKTICDYRFASGDPEPTRLDILGSMTLASLKNHMVSSGLGAWTGDPAKLKPGLVASFASTTDPTYKYVAGIAYVYDEALAIEALLAGTPDAECQARAFQIADALVLIQDRDPMNASAAFDLEFPALKPAPLRDGYGAGIVAASRTATTVTVRNVGITTTSSGNQAYVAMALLRAADVAETAGDAARAADYRRTAKELLLCVARNRLRPDPLEGFGLSNSPTIGTARATEHNVDLSAAFGRAADMETDPDLKVRWQEWGNWAEHFRNAMYGPNERFPNLPWIRDDWDYFRAGTDTGDGINYDLIPIDVGAWSDLALNDSRDLPFDLLEFLTTSTDAKGRTYTGFDPGFRAVDDNTLTNRRDGVGAEVTAYMILIARKWTDTDILARLNALPGLTPDEQTAYDRIVAMANAGGPDHNLAENLVSQIANIQLYAPNTDGLGLVAAPVRNVCTGETGSNLINGWSLAATCWARFAYASWNIFTDPAVV